MRNTTQAKTLREPQQENSSTWKTQHRPRHYGNHNRKTVLHEKHNTGQDITGTTTGKQLYMKNTTQAKTLREPQQENSSTWKTQHRPRHYGNHNRKTVLHEKHNTGQDITGTTTGKQFYMRNTTKTQTEPNLPKAPIARTGVIQIFSCCWLKMGVGWGGESHSYSDGTFYSVFATKHREKIQKNIPPPPPPPPTPSFPSTYIFKHVLYLTNKQQKMNCNTVFGNFVQHRQKCNTCMGESLKSCMTRIQGQLKALSGFTVWRTCDNKALPV